jgi:BirA family transcriptional regulator, biotin operon repressor / biotin---[acetyl-CoA-carboxylase] ligase
LLILKLRSKTTKKYLHKIFTHTLFVGKQVVYLPSCPSTNETAAQMLALNQLHEGAVVIAEHQTAGKGQRGNSWEAEPGKNLTFSIVLKPHFLKVTQQFRLNVVIALAVSDTLQAYVSEGLKVKWPNDLYYYDNKLGGILIENTLKKNQIDTAIVGIGLNLNQTAFSIPSATSLATICNQLVDKREVLTYLLTKIEARYFQLKKNDWEPMLREYYARLYWMDGKPHTFKAEEYFTGVIEGIDEYGRLRIDDGQHCRVFAVKEIQFMR